MSTDKKPQPRDIIASWFPGHDQAYRVADRHIMDLYAQGFDIEPRDHIAGLMEELERQSVTIDTLRIKIKSLTERFDEAAGYKLVKPGQAVTADGVVCDIEKETKAHIKGVSYLSCVLRPVVDLPEGGTR